MNTETKVVLHTISLALWVLVALTAHSYSQVIEWLTLLLWAAVCVALVHVGFIAFRILGAWNEMVLED